MKTKNNFIRRLLNKYGIGAVLPDIKKDGRVLGRVGAMHYIKTHRHIVSVQAFDANNRTVRGKIFPNEITRYFVFGNSAETYTFPVFLN